MWRVHCVRLYCTMQCVQSIILSNVHLFASEVCTCVCVQSAICVHTSGGMFTSVKAKCDDEVMCGVDLPQQQQQR